VYAAALSPDGKQIAYTYQAEAWIYDFDRAQSQRITHLTENGLPQPNGSEVFDGVRDVIWSPDGERIALEMTCNCPSPWSGVGLVDLKSQETRLLADGGNQISWTADGSKVAFRNASGDWASGYTFDFYTVDLEGGAVTNLTNSNPRWDPYQAAPDTYQESDYQTTGLKWGLDGRYLYETQSFRPEGLLAHSFIVRANPELIVKEFFSDSREQAWQVFPTWLMDGRMAYLAVDPYPPDPADPDLFRLRRIEIEGETAQEWGAELIFRSMAWAPDGSALAMLLPPDTHGQPERVQFILMK
jgi:dipeptidyl aminopeptidase/acylaminoacyl peptidase